MSKNNAADDLMALLNSLSGAERRYFRIHASRWGHGDCITMQLYEYLSETGAWDEEAIRKHFAGKPLLKQLNVARTRLQEGLLQALRDFDNGRTYQLEFSRRLDEIDVLFRRKLYSACLRVTKSAQRRAQSLELPLQELSVLAMLLRLERQRGGADLAERMSALHLRHSLVAKQLTAEMELLAIHDTMLALLTRMGAHPARAEAEALLLTPVMMTGPGNLAFDAKVLYWHVMAYHALIVGDHGAYHTHYQHLVEVWDSLPDRMRLEEERAFKTFASFAESAALADRIDQMPRAIEKLKRLLANSSSLKAVEHARILNLELEYLIKASHFRRAAELAEKVSEWLKSSEGKVSGTLRSSLISNALVACFLNGLWESVLQWATKLATALGSSGGEQLQGLVWIAQWVALYELHRDEDLERSLRPHLKATRSTESSAVAMGMSALLDSTDETQERRVLYSILDHVNAQQAISPMPHLDLAAIWIQARVTHLLIMQVASKEDARG